MVKPFGSTAPSEWRPNDGDLVNASDKPNVIRETDAEAIRLAKTLIRTARYGALAVLDPQSGAPLASRVGVATDLDGTPLILISLLAAHTNALLADPRCSLLLGDPGKGDPLAHPRITLSCLARKLERDGEPERQARRRYLNRNPKAELYAGLGDFWFFRLELQSASLNAGFGKAYLLQAGHLDVACADGLADAEQSAIDHMNVDHAEAIKLYARHFAKIGGDGWRITGIDAEGVDIASGDQSRRFWFERPLAAADELRSVLVDMANTARNQGGHLL